MRTYTIRLPEDDWAALKALAKARRIKFKTFVQLLVHQVVARNPLPSRPERLYPPVRPTPAAPSDAA